MVAIPRDHKQYWIYKPEINCTAIPNRHTQISARDIDYQQSLPPPPPTPQKNPCRANTNNISFYQLRPSKLAACKSRYFYVRSTKTLLAVNYRTTNTFYYLLSRFLFSFSFSLRFLLRVSELSSRDSINSSTLEKTTRHNSKFGNLLYSHNSTSTSIYLFHFFLWFVPFAYFAVCVSFASFVSWVCFFASYIPLNLLVPFKHYARFIRYVRFVPFICFAHFARSVSSSSSSIRLFVHSIAFRSDRL